MQDAESDRCHQGLIASGSVRVHHRKPECLLLSSLSNFSSSPLRVKRIFPERWRFRTATSRSWTACSTTRPKSGSSSSRMRRPQRWDSPASVRSPLSLYIVILLKLTKTSLGVCYSQLDLYHEHVDRGMVVRRIQSRCVFSVVAGGRAVRRLKLMKHSTGAFFPFVMMFGGLAQFLAGMWGFVARDTLVTVRLEPLRLAAGHSCALLRTASAIHSGWLDIASRRSLIRCGAASGSPKGSCSI